jgi:DNA-binding LytR/AlgR family response regulator
MAIKDYVKVVTLKKNYLVRKNLKTFSVDLSDDDFIRVSRSIVVNVTKITLIDRNMVYLSDSSFKIGGMYTEAVNKLMHK